MQLTDTLPKWKQTLNVDYVKEIQLMRKMCAAERIETAWVSSISMFTFLEMTVTVFVHFRPLEKNQPTSYRWRDNLSYSCLKLFLTGLLVIHIPQWHKSTWKTLWPWVWNSSMWQWHTEQSVMLFKIKRPHLKSGSRKKKDIQTYKKPLKGKASFSDQVWLSVSSWISNTDIAPDD